MRKKAGFLFLPGFFRFLHWLKNQLFSFLFLHRSLARQTLLAALLRHPAVVIRLFMDRRENRLLRHHDHGNHDGDHNNHPRTDLAESHAENFHDRPS